MKHWSTLIFGLACFGMAQAVEVPVLPVIDAGNRIVNIDEVLAVPSPGEAKIVMDSGVPVIELNGEPFGSMGISSLFLRNMSDADIQAMMKESGFALNHITFTLGEDGLYLDTLNHGSTWLGSDQYDWSPLERKLQRIHAVNPATKLIIQVDLDGAKWWTQLHPEASADVAKGIPDYLHPDWKRDSREAVRQMVGHIQTSPYRDMVIAYTLFNGPSLDCNWRPNLTTPTALMRFRDWLRERYADDAALQAAWHDQQVTFQTAQPSLTADPAQPDTYPLLHAPAEQRRLDDTMKFRSAVWEEVILDFARNIKEATQRRALTGARCGNLLFGYWGWEDQGGFGQPGDVGSEAVNALLDSPDFDYFDQWASYFGRVLGDGDCGGPVMPVRGVGAHGKIILLQNDIPTHINNEPGYGATGSLAETQSMQRRIFAHALTLGMYPYLWQMSSSFNVPEMMSDWQTMQQVMAKSARLPRDSAAEIVYVVDRDFHHYLGKDHEVKHPTRGMALIDYGRLEWGRAGAGFDMIYLDQLEEAPDYKLYVFYHTLHLSEAEIQVIHAKLARNQAVGVFVWADGIIDATGNFSTANMSQLTGMEIVATAQPLTWEMKPAEALLKAGFDPARRVGISEYIESCDLAYPARNYPPSLAVNDQRAVALATHPASGEVTLAETEFPEGFLSVYSASPILTPELLRYLGERAGVFRYLDSDDALYLNESFIGVHTRPATESVTLRFPEATALYEVFTGVEYPAATEHRIPAAGKSTLLFFRGTREHWNAI